MDESMRPGQRWMSEPEPELGHGIVRDADRFQVALEFPASGESRLYARRNAPLKRIRFNVGDTVFVTGGRAMIVERVEEDDGLLRYGGDAGIFRETDLDDSESHADPIDRLFQGTVDAPADFDLRFDALRHTSRIRNFGAVGFLGGRIDLIPHQIHIASEVASRHLPRVLLADEVGLGKTIEACLIIHRLHITGRADRILIIVPDSLVHQWFVELLRRFNLWFTLMDVERCEAVAGAGENADARNPFLEEQRIICSLSLLVENERWARCAEEAGWDILIVDEAHHLSWSPEGPEPEYAVVERLARKAPGLLLLTATPEQLGITGHFARLRLLDPARYPDLGRFREEQKQFAKVAGVAEKIHTGHTLTGRDRSILETLFENDRESLRERLEALHEDSPGARTSLLDELVDRHGTGRVLFRNTREALTGFPQRTALPAPLDPRPGLSPEESRERLLREFELETDPALAQARFDYRGGPRAHWLAELLRSIPEEKILVICRTPAKALALAEALAAEINAKAAVFHEGLSLIQRDRNAAWFAEPDGAQLLVCSEIGSEGRNFQFAHHLVLFDLPLDPELLEQRIGRLDRIGQTTDIKIHIPYLKGSAIELLYRWHHEGLAGIENALRGGNAYLDKFGDRVRRVARNFHLSEREPKEETGQLIADTKRYRIDLEERLRQGQDRLLAIQSNRPERANVLIEQIRNFDEDPALEDFMFRVFDHFGVDAGELGQDVYFLRSGNFSAEVLPGLPEGGLPATFDRATALGREDIHFLTWDHPIVRDSIDMILSADRGTSGIVTLPVEQGAPPVLLEAVYVLECVAPPRLHVDRFLPPLPFRVVVDPSGQDLSSDHPIETIRRKAHAEAAPRIEKNLHALRALATRMLAATREIAVRQSGEAISLGRQRARRKLAGEARRLRELSRINPAIRDEEIRFAESSAREIDGAIGKAHIRLDAARLILTEATAP